MPAGEMFTADQAGEIDRVVRGAQQRTGLRFSVWVGRVDGDTRQHARRLHAALGKDASRAVLLAVDPVGRQLEVVTGDEARSVLDDRTCTLAAMSMTSSFGVGDLTGGITDGVAFLADHAQQPPVRHEHPVD